MRSENSSVGQDERSFIEKARRAQIVECATIVIAELGYAQASLAEIAKRAGVSKGVISYYFAGKNELIREVMHAVTAKATAEMVARVMAEKSATRRLRAYIESNLDFLARNHNGVLALINISLGAMTDESKPLGDMAAGHELVLTPLEDLFRDGQKSGEFRRFSTRVMAITLRAAIDSAAHQLAANPKLDIKSYANELATLFEMATRK